MAHRNGRYGASFPVILEPINLYCARTGPGALVEPLNLLAGLAFLPVGLQVARWARDMPQLRLMAGLVVLLCPGALWLHSYPSPLALGANLLTILVLLLNYFYLLNRDIAGLSPVLAAIGTLLILPFAAATLPLAGMVRGLAGSGAYLSVLVLLLGYATALRQDNQSAARGLFLAAAMMLAAIAARSVDHMLCGIWPPGTHFLWILGSAALLWQLARLYRDHALTTRGGLEGTRRGR